MDLKLKCTVSHGIGWNGGVREYSDDILVNLTQEEIAQIKNVLSQREDNKSLFGLEESLPEIYTKIEEAAFDFKLYTLVLDTCLHWNTEFGDVKEEDLIEEDIQSGKFVPFYENVEGSNRDTIIMSQWFVWMINGLRDLSYRERIDYLVKRYQMDLPSYDELEFETTYRLA